MRGCYDDSGEIDLDGLMLLWDGKFKENSELPGDWKLVGEIEAIEDFGPSAKQGRVRQTATTRSGVLQPNAIA